MTKKQDEEYLKQLKEIKEALFRLQPQVVYVPTIQVYGLPSPYQPLPYIPYYPWVTTTITGITNFQVGQTQLETL